MVRRQRLMSHCGRGALTNILGFWLRPQKGHTLGVKVMLRRKMVD